MSRTQMAPVQAPTYPQHDSHYHRGQGIQKNKKSIQNGGGRAWREDEESYLLQTRLQKMPYKHIAAHLNKTELACRLHFHQLSHSSGRRKRTASCSSGSSGQSPVLAALVASPAGRSEARSMSPARYAGYGNVNGNVDMQLPSIVSAEEGLGSRLPAILPKPTAMGPHGRAHGYHPTGAPENYGPLPRVNFDHHNAHQQTNPPLRLNCTSLPPPSASTQTPEHVDLSRLQSIYTAYRDDFWTAIANEYGSDAGPAALEMAWKTSSCCSQHPGGPMTPGASPDREYKRGFGAGPDRTGLDRTRISSILSGDADVMGRERRW